MLLQDLFTIYIIYFGIFTIVFTYVQVLILNSIFHLYWLVVYMCKTDIIMRDIQQSVLILLCPRKCSLISYLIVILHELLACRHSGGHLEILINSMTVSPARFLKDHGC